MVLGKLVNHLYKNETKTLSNTIVKSLSCRTLCDPMDYSPLDSSVHGILQARILEWVAIAKNKLKMD